MNEIKEKSRHFKWWTKQEVDNLIELLSQGLQFSEISKKINRTKNACSLKASKLGFQSWHIKKRKYEINESFWKDFNFLNCYYAGILAADGCLRLNNKKFKYAGSLEWQVASKDRILLEAFKDISSYQGPISDGIYGGHRKSKLYIKCQTWNKDLFENFNIIPNKTFRVMPPHGLTDQQMFCWLIGYIDGDGCLTFNKIHKKLVLSITSCSKELLDFIYEFLKERFPLKIKKSKECKPRKDKIGNYWTLGIYGIRATCLYSYLKQYNLPKLVRKWDQPKINELEAAFKESHSHFFDFSHLPPPA